MQSQSQLTGAVLPLIIRAGIAKSRSGAAVGLTQRVEIVNVRDLKYALCLPRHGTAWPGSPGGGEKQRVAALVAPVLLATRRELKEAEGRTEKVKQVFQKKGKSSGSRMASWTPKGMRTLGMVVAPSSRR